jgi:hypothetical protein
MNRSQEGDLTESMSEEGTLNLEEGALENDITPTTKQPSDKSTSIILPGIAVFISTLALVGTVFTLQQISGMRQSIKELKTTLSKSSIAVNPAATTAGSAPISNTTASNPAPSAILSSSEIKPGQFVQLAFGNEAQVELLSLKRIQNPDSGERDVVNVQMRIRRLAPDDVYGDNSINVAATRARNPETSQTYEALGFDRSTGPVSLSSMRKGASADGYVWMKIPEGVNTVDLFIPDTKAFTNVPISN